ncbi:MAG: hypothetical protein K8F36_01970 [Melioribacteraceae bacterium]|nr:hypothetical protein [Melioribacteraceae bacterium]MCO6473290.1 hypothetical protein [Melioribacteraceae bacterium]MDD3558245.1 hypothetical protein [Melioribacteraceae bacterium]
MKKFFLNVETVSKGDFDNSTSSVQVRTKITDYSMTADFDWFSSVPTFYVGM